MAKKKNICKHCGEPMVKTAKICPNCGGKNPVPFFSRWYVWAVILALLFGAWNSLTAEPADYDGNAPRPDVEYTEVTIDELAEEFDANELRAKDTYLDAYVSVTGRLRVIDEDGVYFEIYPLEYDSLDSIHCVMNHDDQREKLKEYSKDDTITVKGQITEVGSFYDLRLKVDCIE